MVNISFGAGQRSYQDNPLRRLPPTHRCLRRIHQRRDQSELSVVVVVAVVVVIVIVVVVVGVFIVVVVIVVIVVPHDILICILR